MPYPCSPCVNVQPETDHLRPGCDSFYNSLSDVEKKHFVSAVQFELGKCDEAEVQQRIIDKYNIIDHDLAVQIGSAFGGLTVPDEVRKNHGQKSEFLSQVTGTNQVFT